MATRRVKFWSYEVTNRLLVLILVLIVTIAIAGNYFIIPAVMAQCKQNNISYVECAATIDLQTAKYLWSLIR